MNRAPSGTTVRIDSPDHFKRDPDAAKASPTIAYLTSLAKTAQPDLTEEQAKDRAYAAVVRLMGDITPTEAAARGPQAQEVA
jgi:hypothetical protein